MSDTTRETLASAVADEPRASGFTPLTVALLVVSVLAQVAAFVLQRVAGLRTAAGSAASTWLDPYFFGSIAMLTINGVVWPLVLRRVPLSRAYPFTAFIPVLNLAVAALVLSEVVTPQHVVGMFLVAGGVWILAGRRR